MQETDVIREIREIREAFAAEHDYDIDRMMEALRHSDSAKGRKVVSFARDWTSGETPVDLRSIPEPGKTVSDASPRTAVDAA